MRPSGSSSCPEALATSVALAYDERRITQDYCGRTGSGSDFWSKVHSSGERSACPVVLLLIGFPMVSVAQAETRIALLLGNQSYSKDIGVLANPHG